MKKSIFNCCGLVLLMTPVLLTACGGGGSGTNSGGKNQQQPNATPTLGSLNSNPANQPTSSTGGLGLGPAISGTVGNPGATGTPDTSGTSGASAANPSNPSYDPTLGELVKSIYSFQKCSSGGIYNDANGYLLDSGVPCKLEDSAYSSHPSLSRGQAWASPYGDLIGGQSYNYIVLLVGNDGNVTQYAVPDLASLANNQGWLVLNSTATARGSRASGGFPLGIKFSTSQSYPIPAYVGTNLNGILKNQGGYGSAWCGKNGDTCWTALSDPASSSSTLTFVNGRLQYQLNGGISNGSKIANLTSSGYKSATDDIWDTGNADTSLSDTFELVLTTNVTINHISGSSTNLAWSTNLP